MKKLNAEEILAIVEANMSVEEFAYRDYPTPDDFIGTEEVNEAKRLSDEAKETWEEAVKGLDYQQRKTPEIEALWKKYAELPNYQDQLTKEWLTSLGLGEIVEVYKYGGEDCGSTWYSVKYFVDHDVYIRTDGYYSSYNGTDFEDGYGDEVKKVERLVTVFE